MSDRLTFKIDRVEGGGISADGREVYLDIQSDGDPIRLVLDLTQARPAGVALLAMADAAQRAAGIGHLANFIRAETASAAPIVEDAARFALSLRLEGGSSLSVSLPRAAALVLSGALEALASSADAPPGAVPGSAKH